MQTITMHQTKPWYRYPLLWMMILIPFSAVIMGVVMAWLAIDTDDGLVVDDYYKEGIEINQVLHRDEAATRLGIQAMLKYDNASRVLRLVLHKGALADYPPTIALHIQHATLKKDRYVILQRGISNQQAGQYSGVLKKPLSNARWYFEIGNKQWRLVSRYRVRGSFDVVFSPLPVKAPDTVRPD